MEYIKHGTLYNYFKDMRNYCLNLDEIKTIMIALL